MPATQPYVAGGAESRDVSRWLENQELWFPDKMSQQILSQNKRQILEDSLKAPAVSQMQRDTVAVQTKDFMQLVEGFQSKVGRCPISGRSVEIQQALEDLWKQRPAAVEAFNRGLAAADMASFVPMMERATRRRDRLSLLTLLEGSVDSKKSLAVFNALFDSGGLKALNSWLADGENEKSSVKVWQRVLNFLNRYAWVPVQAPSAKPSAQAPSQKAAKKESRADLGVATNGPPEEGQRVLGSDWIGVAASAAPELTSSSEAHGDAKLAAGSKIPTSEHLCNGVKVEPGSAMDIDPCSKVESIMDGKAATEANAVSSQAPLCNDQPMEDATTKSTVKLEVTEAIGHAHGTSSSPTTLNSSEKGSEKQASSTEQSTEHVGPHAASSANVVHIYEKEADSPKPDAPHVKPEGGDASEGEPPVHNAAPVSSAVTEAGTDKASPRPADSDAQAVDRLDAGASESGTPRLSHSREPSDVGSRRGSTESVGAVPVSAESAPPPKAEKSRKESKSKSDKHAKGKTAHELVMLIVEAGIGKTVKRLSRNKSPDIPEVQDVLGNVNFLSKRASVRALLCDDAVGMLDSGC